jgi:hypothetical protein
VEHYVLQMRTHFFLNNIKGLSQKKWELGDKASNTVGKEGHFVVTCQVHLLSPLYLNTCPNSVAQSLVQRRAAC